MSSNTSISTQLSGLDPAPSFSGWLGDFSSAFNIEQQHDSRNITDSNVASADLLHYSDNIEDDSMESEPSTAAGQDSTETYNHHQQQVFHCLTFNNPNKHRSEATVYIICFNYFFMICGWLSQHR